MGPGQATGLQRTAVHVVKGKKEVRECERRRERVGVGGRESGYCRVGSEECAQTWVHGAALISIMHCRTLTG